MATVSKGNCYLCGAELGKTAMKNHFLKKHGEGEQEYVDIPPKSPLSLLDQFLRDIWLECCGHMSAFRTGGGGWGEDIGKSRKVGSFEPGDKIVHEYDFGSTTETLITFVGKTKRPPQRNAVRLLARNVAARRRRTSTRRPCTIPKIRSIAKSARKAVTGICCFP